METKKYTQFGTVSVVILLPLFLLFVVLTIKSALANSPELVVLGIVSITFLLCLLTFYKLTITVDNTHVSFKMGIGLFSKSYKIADLRSCTPVTNSAIYGIGIRMLPGGWLYNVSGLKAIELRFKHKTSVVRIGTNKPDEISEIIQSLIGSEDVSEHNDKPAVNWMKPLFYLFVLLVVAFVAIPNYRETKVQFENDTFKIKGTYGLTIQFKDIEQVDTVSSIPKISLRTNGYAFSKTLIGNFRFTDGSNAKLFVKKGFGPFVVIKSKERVPVYINFEDKQKTIDLYNRLKIKE
jgi:hypothetical protein